MLLFLIAFSCKKEAKKTDMKTAETVKKIDPFFKLSLAQWSLHKYVINEKKSPFHFASQAKEMGFEGIEYVSQLYSKEIEKLGFDAVIDSLNALSKKHEIQNVLIMVDGEGDLADPSEEVRNKAV
ncbi:MAG: sugar phosphate isomerase/epimerase, partial [Polaribacter sp.]